MNRFKPGVCFAMQPRKPVAQPHGICSCKFAVSNIVRGGASTLPITYNQTSFMQRGAFRCTIADVPPRECLITAAQAAVFVSRRSARAGLSLASCLRPVTPHCADATPKHVCGAAAGAAHPREKASCAPSSTRTPQGLPQIWANTRMCGWPRTVSFVVTRPRRASPPAGRVLYLFSPWCCEPGRGG